MALLRKDVRAIMQSEDLSDDQKVTKLLDMVHDEFDPVLDERDKYKKSAEDAKNGNDATAKEWREKYEAEVEAHKRTKAEQVEKATKELKQNALKDLLSGELSERGMEKAIKYSTFDFELDDKGKIKEASKVLKTYREEWSDFAIESKTEGAEKQEKATTNPANSTKMTKEEILKISDASERQTAMAENHELFGF